MDSMPVSYSHEAMRIAQEWATGKRSHLNEFLAVEVAVSGRPWTLAAVATADAQEVVKWTAVASALNVQETERARRRG